MRDCHALFFRRRGLSRSVSTFTSTRSTPFIYTRFMSTDRSFDYHCGMLAESPNRYKPGGFHPVHLGDVFAGGRYKVLHKLGDGGFATIWIARDLLAHRNVALKINVSEELSSRTREGHIMEMLSKSIDPSQPGWNHIVRLLDQFEHTGPNGVHACSVLELLGPSVPAVVNDRFWNDRLPGPIAKKVCKELCLAVQFLHKHDVGHGDIHTGNLVFAMPGLDTLSNDELFEKYWLPQTSPVSRTDGSPLEAGVPKYLVGAADYTVGDLVLEEYPIQLIDFGESFLPHDRSKTLHNPMALRAPELLFEDEYDFRVDLWTLGCTMFELVAGQPLCCSIMAKNENILQEIAELIGEPPEKWQPQWKAVPKWDQSYDDDPAYTLEQWLNLLYFDDGKRCELTKKDIKQFGTMISGLLQWCPSDRSSVTEVLSSDWFRDC